MHKRINIRVYFLHFKVPKLVESSFVSKILKVHLLFLNYWTCQHPAVAIKTDFYRLCGETWEEIENVGVTLRIVISWLTKGSWWQVTQIYRDHWLMAQPLYEGWWVLIVIIGRSGHLQITINFIVLAKVLLEILFSMLTTFLLGFTHPPTKLFFLLLFFGK